MAKKEYIYATGKRKSSIARVNIIPGTGKITIGSMLSSFEIYADHPIEKKDEEK